MNVYKYKFFSINELHNNEKTEIATCLDKEMAEKIEIILMDRFFRKCNGIKIIMKFKNKEITIVPATYGN